MISSTNGTYSYPVCTLKEHLDSTLMDFSVVKYRADNPNCVFGDEATESLTTQIVGTTPTTLNNQIFMFSTTMGAMIIFSLMIALFRRAIAQILSIMFSFHFTSKIEQLFNSNLERLLNYCYFIVMPTIALYVSILAFNNLLPLDGLELLYHAAGIVILYGFYLYKRVLLDIIGYIVNNKELRKNIIYTTKLQSLIPSLLLLPFLLLLSHSDMSNTAALYSILILVSLLLINYIITLYIFLKSFSFSFFQYILYLCAVEIVPISFIFVFLYRNSTNIF